MSLFESFWGGTNRSKQSRTGNDGGQEGNLEGMNSFCMRDYTQDDNHDISLASLGQLNKSQDADHDEEKAASAAAVAEDDNEVIDHDEHDEEHDGEEEEDDGEEDSTGEMEIDPFAAMVIGSLCCWCKPVKSRGLQDIFYRTIYWTGLNKDQILGGIVVAIGQVPEVAAYSILAGVDPLHGFHATWIMGMVTAFFGGRPGMISGYTAASAVATLNLVQSKGVDYVYYAILLAALLQIASGVMQFGRVLRFVPYSAMVGFRNVVALILIFSQLKFFKVPQEGINATAGVGRAGDVSYHSNYYNVLSVSSSWIDLPTLTVMLLEAGTTFLICFLIPKLTKLIPGTYVALCFVTILEWVLARMINFPGLLVRDYITVTPPSMPTPIFFDSNVTLPPISFETFLAVYPTAIALFIATTAENLLTFRVVGDKVETKGSSNRMLVGQGLGQFISALMGGMGGGAMLGQSMINYKSGGITCLSSFIAGFSMFMVLAVAFPAVGIVPLGAIVGLMLYSIFSIVEWTSLVSILSAVFPQRVRDILFLDCKVNRSDTFIMLAVMALAFFFDLGMAAFVGATIAAYAFSWDCSNRLEVDRVIAEGEDTVTYRIKGAIYGATTQILLNLFTQDEIVNDPGDVILFLEEAEVYDWSGQVALKTLYDRIESCGKTVALSSLTPMSKKMMEKNSAMWYGVVFLEVEEMDEETLESMKKSSSAAKYEAQKDASGTFDEQDGADGGVPNVETVDTDDNEGDQQQHEV